MADTMPQKADILAGDISALSRDSVVRQALREEPLSATAPAEQLAESRLHRIARRAHEIYEARRGEHGAAMEDWLQAEREIDAESDAQQNAQSRDELLRKQLTKPTP